MNTDARRKASADYHAKLKAEGHKKVTLFLSPEALAALGKLATGDTSKAQAVNAALIEAARRQLINETLAKHEPAEWRTKTPAAEDPRKPQETAPKAHARTAPKKPAKPTSEPVSQTAGLSVQVGPSPFTPRLKGSQKGKAK